MIRITDEIQKQLIGLSTGTRRIRYTWKDLALYALSVGAGKDDLLYTFENGIKAVPTYCATPYWAALGVEPELAYPKPAPVYVEDIIHNTIAPLHMDHEVIIHKLLDPNGGAMVYEDTITDIYDRGEGKGVVLKSRLEVRDPQGELLCTNIANTIYTEFGGFGGTPMPKNTTVIPAADPDYVLEDYIYPAQNMFYRLTSGDTNLVHADPAYAKEHGHDRVFMQGMCSYGFACRMAVSALIPGQPERMTRMYAQMRSILYPDTKIRLLLWKTEENRALFRLVDENGKAILDRGIMEWKECVY